jgi:hypothetical protein
MFMEPTKEAKQSTDILILLVSGSCCAPALGLIDQQAQHIIRQALDATGLSAQIRVLPASSALQGGIPPEILKELSAAGDPATLIRRLPALFINGKLIGFGVPDLEQVKSALRLTQAETKS